MCKCNKSKVGSGAPRPAIPPPAPVSLPQRFSGTNNTPKAGNLIKNYPQKA